MFSSLFQTEAALLTELQGPISSIEEEKHVQGKSKGVKHTHRIWTKQSGHTGVLSLFLYYGNMQP